MSLIYPEKEEITEYIVSNCGKFGADEIIDELIRCKDCTFYNDLDSYCYVHSILSYGDYLDDNSFYFYVDDDDYCSRAERKEEEE